jgi:translation initiation factor 2B subunit (eIF-2B alpha/beta/delta family)
VAEVAALFEAQALHAARSGREVMSALAAVAAESPAASVDGLSAELEANLEALLHVMPAYAPPLNAMHQVFAEVERGRDARLPLAELKSRLAQTASDYQAWSSSARQVIAANALPLIMSGSTVFTFTLSETVLGVLREVHRRGARFRVLVTESRPNNDGRLTARSLSDEGIEVGLGIDASVGELLAQADLMLVGAEAVLCDGSAICKAGTYPAALAARRSNVPVYVLVDTMKLHVGSLFGEALRLDPIQSTSLPRATTTDELAVRGHLFDRTPAALLTALITEKGIVHPSQAGTWMLGMPFSQTVAGKLGGRGPRRGQGD